MPPQLALLRGRTKNNARHMPAGVRLEQRVDERLRGFENLSFGGQVLMVLRARFVLKYFTVDFVDE